MKFIKQIWYFLYPPNDWVVVWSDSAYWKWDTGGKDYVFYRIEFSKYKDQFRLIATGKGSATYKKCGAVDHPYYNVALSKLAEYNNNLLQIQFNSKNKIK